MKKLIKAAARPLSMRDLKINEVKTVTGGTSTVLNRGGL